MSACTALGTHIPSSFEPITGSILEFIAVLGEERCTVLDIVCEGYSEKEYDFFFYAMMNEMSRLMFLGFNNATKARLGLSFKLLHTAAYAAPAAAVFLAGRKRNVQDELRSVGQIINSAGADSLVVEIPDMERHDPVILSGAIVALSLNVKDYTAELLRDLGENWRVMAPHRKMMQDMEVFDLALAHYFVDGGSAALTDGVL